MFLSLTGTQENIIQQRDAIFTHQISQRQTSSAWWKCPEKAHESHAVAVIMSYKKAEAIQSGPTTENYCRGEISRIQHSLAHSSNNKHVRHAEHFVRALFLRQLKFRSLQTKRKWKQPVAERCLQYVPAFIKTCSDVCESLEKVVEGSAAPGQCWVISTVLWLEVHHRLDVYTSFCFAWPEHRVTKAVTCNFKKSKNITALVYTQQKNSTKSTSAWGTESRVHPLSGRRVQSWALCSGMTLCLLTRIHPPTQGASQEDFASHTDSKFWEAGWKHGLNSWVPMDDMLHTFSL